MNEYKLFVQRIGLVGITNILIALSSLILLPIMTKSFSIGDYGVWVQINTTIALIPNLATLGLPYTMVRFLSAEKNKEKIQEGFYSIASIVLASTFIISALLFIFSKNIASALFNGDVNIAILLVYNCFLCMFKCTFTQLLQDISADETIFHLFTHSNLFRSIYCFLFCNKRIQYLYSSTGTFNCKFSHIYHYDHIYNFKHRLQNS